MGCKCPPGLGLLYLTSNLHQQAVRPQFHHHSSSPRHPYYIKYEFNLGLITVMPAELQTKFCCFIVNKHNGKRLLLLLKY